MASWISVKDRLPLKYEGYCLVAFDDKSIDTMWAHNISLHLDTNERYPVGWMVTHWMPLPEPPNEVQTNIFNEEETYPNCTVQILKNSVTGETSIGWWENKETE